MSFDSLQFLVFFVVMFFLYYSVVPDRYRWLLLLLGSCYFYMAYIPKFILILFFLITVDYVLGIQISKATGHRRKIFLVMSIIANLGTLFFFKYFNFFNENVAVIAQLIHWNYPLVLLDIALPLGLSFHVFQSLSYVIEVYKGKQEPERHYGIYALYVMFFPQLVAGPIERPQQLLHQFHESHSFDYAKIRRGFELMLWGFFKKLVIADRIGLLVDHIYSNISGTNGVSVIIAAVFFAYQIYCDFSGYSDIAVGTALVFGYDLVNNFERPYASRSIAELWQRWHISLSSWLKDYLYYPLAFAGKKITKARIYLSIFITFVLIGLWHGANWTYVIFGTLQGVYMIFSSWTASARNFISRAARLVNHKALRQIWQTGVTFFLFTVSLVFFRAADMPQAFQVFGKAWYAIAHPVEEYASRASIFSYSSLGITTKFFLIIIVAIIFMEFVQYLQAKKGTRFILENKSRLVRWSAYYGLVFSILVVGYLGAEPFIYFKF